jgi:asparagine synthetase B (glutamine-hydrolysing)
MGLKPLYYRRYKDGRIDFASELKVLAYPEYEPDLCTLNASLMGLGQPMESQLFLNKLTMYVLESGCYLIKMATLLEKIFLK